MGKKWLLVSISLLALVLAVMPVLAGGCAQEAAGPKTLKLGTVMPISGPWGPIGQAWDRGYDIFADMINEQGGLKVGGDTYLIQFIHEDDKADPTAASTAATKLVAQDKVDFLLGSITEDMSKPIQDVTKEAGVLHVLTYSVVPEPYSWGAGSDEPLMVLLCPPDCRGFEFVMDYFVANYPQVKTIVHSVNLYPQDALITLAEELYADRGIEVVGVELFDPAAADFYPWATACLKWNPDAVSIDHSGPAQEGLQIKALREQGFKGPVISYSPISPIFLLQGAGAENCYDIICASAYAQAPDVPDAMAGVVDGWNAKYPGEAFIDDALMSYDCAWELCQVIEKAQSLDPQVVMNTFESMTQPGSLQSTYGPAHMGGEQTIGANREIVRTWAISVIQGEDITNVEWATPEIP